MNFKKKLGFYFFVYVFIFTSALSAMESRTNPHVGKGYFKKIKNYIRRCFSRNYYFEKDERNCLKQETLKESIISFMDFCKKFEKYKETYNFSSVLFRKIIDKFLVNDSDIRSNFVSYMFIYKKYNFYVLAKLLKNYEYCKSKKYAIKFLNDFKKEIEFKIEKDTKMFKDVASSHIKISKRKIV
ncbi:hypothetical protein ACFLYH_00965 [Candidatus Dependentiae bacterium]